MLRLDCGVLDGFCIMFFVWRARLYRYTFFFYISAWEFLA
jgi:hypothetical protein